MSSAGFRPGVASGDYPERIEPKPGWAERLLQVPLGSRARRREQASIDRIVARVERHAKRLAGTTESGLRQATLELRRQLGREGLSDALLPAAFALVREVAGRVLGTPHYDVQLMGGWIMARGGLAEMQTGEGKTLTATLPACAAALAGIPVHVISSNDYLVARDAETMGPIYHALGLSVGTVVSTEPDPSARRAAYACDVTYGTGNQIAFDYLRDRVLCGGQRGLPLRLERLHRQRPRSEQLLLRGLCFGIVDEADSVLIDEARTPLILSRPSQSSEQRQVYKRALRMARGLDGELHYQIDPRSRNVTLTTRGQERLAELAEPLKGGFFSGPRRRSEWVERALAALHCHQRDRHYLVRDDKVEIIDQGTGRVAVGRSWEHGLHQLIELKEGCTITPQNETLARISYQQFFRRYLRLAGMTGTAREVARELWSVYRLNTLAVPTRLPSQRRGLGTRVFESEAEHWNATAERIEKVRGSGRPVLVGTGSVRASEQLSQVLTQRGVAHRVLNARQDADEAAIVAEAGQAGRVTVATNMAGRGTDIVLGPGVAERGGLHVIATARSESRRIDRQLFGRCGRQGDPGSYESLIAVGAEAVEMLQSDPSGESPTRDSGPRPGLSGPLWLQDFLSSRRQHAEERRNTRMRRQLIELEEYLGDLLAFSGPAE